MTIPLSRSNRWGTVSRMRSIHNWLDEYGGSHRNRTNKVLHWFCVPVIVWCVMGFLWSIPNLGVNWAILIVLAALLYYSVLSIPLAFGALPIFAAMLWSIGLLASRGSAILLGLCAALFVIAWVGQFIGHAIEGKRPSFFRDIQFLLIGPLWLLADLYRRLGVRY
jgi:uncharacterized membrane protein YGL010W